MWGSPLGGLQIREQCHYIFSTPIKTQSFQSNQQDKPHNGCGREVVFFQQKGAFSNFVQVDIVVHSRRSWSFNHFPWDNNTQGDDYCLLICVNSVLKIDVIFFELAGCIGS